MTSEKIRAALASIVEDVKQIGAERFRAELDARQLDTLAQAFAEIDAFASGYLTSECASTNVEISKILLDAVQTGEIFQSPFELSIMEQWLAANDQYFALAA